MASLSLSLWVPGQGLTCGTGHWLLEGVFNPSPASWGRGRGVGGLGGSSSSAGCCLLHFQSSLLLMVSGHYIYRILLRQMLMMSGTSSALHSWFSALQPWFSMFQLHTDGQVYFGFHNFEPFIQNFRILPIFLDLRKPVLTALPSKTQTGMQ